MNEEDSSVRMGGSIGNREMTFSTMKQRRYKEVDERNKKHQQERKQLVRSTKGIKFKHNPFLWKNKQRRK